MNNCTCSLLVAFGDTLPDLAIEILSQWRFQLVVVC